MSYTKHNFTTGGTIQAAPFNAMENQIAENETAIAGKAAAADLTALAGRVSVLEGGGMRPPTIYCWGDSLTEGVGAYVMMPDNQNAYMAYSYPAFLAQTYNAVNLGARGEDINAIMARQGADPITLQADLSIPASAATPVQVGTLTRMSTYGAGTGLTSKNGALVKINKEVESPGLNPCVIAGVEGILYREIADTSSDEGTYTYYFRRLEDGEAVTAPEGTEVQTFAMRHYRGNGAAIFWMGANGGYSSHNDFCAKVLAMVEYGQYSDYLVILSREFAETYARQIMNILTDEDGVCHVLYLMDQLPYRGYGLAGIPSHTIDTSQWETTDPIKKNAPLLCDFLASQSGEAQYGALHFSAWGYKAIAKLCMERLADMKLYTEISQGGSQNLPQVDEYGTLLYKLAEPRTLNGSRYINTHVKLYDDVDKDWTIVCKYHGTVVCTDGVPYIIFCCMHDGGNDGVMQRYHLADDSEDLGVSEYGASIFCGNSGFSLNGSNGAINRGGENVVIIVKDGNDYSVYINSDTMCYGTPLTYALQAEDAHDLPLLIGARWNLEGTTAQFITAFTLDDFRIYNAALDASDVGAIYDELTASAEEEES